VLPPALLLLVAAAITLRALAALAIAGPWLAPDEMAYALAGRDLWHHADLAVLGGPSQYTSALYPALAGLPLLGGLHAGYAALQVLQAVALCSTGVVVYLWTRSLARPRWALAAAALALALPGGVYAGTLVAETLFVPLATLAGWLAVRALEDPTRRRQALLVVVLLACLLTRGEANMLALALFVAAVVARRVRALVPTWTVLVFAAGVWIGLGGGSPLRSLGSYGVGHAYTVHGVVDFVLEHTGELVLVSGVAPLCAVALLALVRPDERAVRATVAFALALALIASVEVGVFAAGHAGRLLERELLFALPPLFVGFGVWLDRGGPRPRLRTLGVVACAVAALLAVPFGRLVSAAIVPDNPSLVPLTYLDSPKVYGVVALMAIASGALLLALPSGWLWLLPALLTGVFVAVSVSASEEFVDRSQAARAANLTSPPDWVDRAAGGSANLLYDGGPDWQLVWTQLFWNDHITGVIDLPTAHVPGPLPQHQLQILGNDGALRLVDGAVPGSALLTAPTGFLFTGHRLVTAKAISLSLWQLAAPPRVRTWAQGLKPNGDITGGGLATLDVFDCVRGTFHVVAIGRDNETLQLSENGNPVTQTQLWPEGVWELSVKTPAAKNARCTFSLSTTSLVHLSVFAWTPR
jgi:hypothetical protein